MRCTPKPSRCPKHLTPPSIYLTHSCLFLNLSLSREGLLSLQPAFQLCSVTCPHTGQVFPNENNLRLQLLDPEVGQCSSVGECLAWGLVNIIVQHATVPWLLYKLSNEHFECKNISKAKGVLMQLGWLEKLPFLLLRPFENHELHS